MPVQPKTATGTRDTLLPALETWQMQDWLLACDRPAAEGPPPCLMVVADLMPALPGEEAVVLLDRGADYVEIVGLFLDNLGRTQQRRLVHPDGRTVTAEEARQLLDSYRLAPPPLSPAFLNQIGTGEDGLVVLP